ncbi:hypothetical protein GCM10023352_00560 [Rothia endophytica]|uniref:Uncharacterized protein n=1 Tax=Rothia endophytica TaxID=1324766 RepID=A0ABP9AY52_9MICC
MSCYAEICFLITSPVSTFRGSGPLQPVGELGGMLPEHLVDNVVEIKADRCHGHEAFRFIAEHGI